MAKVNLDDLQQINSPIGRSIIQIKSSDRRFRQYKHLGWVYAVRNPCFTDPVFKIGQTGDSPNKRVEALSSSTSVYRSFELVYLIHVSDRMAAEAFVHEALDNFRVNPGREFFEVPLMHMIKTLDEAGSLWQIPLGKTARAGFLPPLLEKRIVKCPHCNAKNRLPQLFIKITVTCSVCRTSHTLTPDVH